MAISISDLEKIERLIDKRLQEMKDSVKEFLETSREVHSDLAVLQATMENTQIKNELDQIKRCEPCRKDIWGRINTIRGQITKHWIILIVLILAVISILSYLGIEVKGLPF